MGSEGHYWFEERDADARNSASLSELLKLGDIDASQASRVKAIARAVPIKNNIPAWNCQDFVVDLLEALEEASIMSNADSVYAGGKAQLTAKMDGLE